MLGWVGDETPWQLVGLRQGTQDGAYGLLHQRATWGTPKVARRHNCAVPASGQNGLLDRGAGQRLPELIGEALPQVAVV